MTICTGSIAVTGVFWGWVLLELLAEKFQSEDFKFWDDDTCWFTWTPMLCWIQKKTAEFYISGKYFTIISGKRSMRANWEFAIITWIVKAINAVQCVKGQVKVQSLVVNFSV